MGRQDDGSTGISGLAKRWLKNQLSFHGDPRRAHREREESEAIEQEIHDRVEQQAQATVARGMFNAFAPAGLKKTVADMQRMSAEQKANETARKQAEHEAKPRASTQLRVSGALSGVLAAELPATIYRPDEPGGALTVELVPLVVESIAGRNFQALLFAIPGYHGPGSYDLEQMARGGAGDDWDPLWFQFVLDDEGEPFYWTPEGGRARIAVAEDEKQLSLTMQMSNASSEDITLEARIALP